MISYPERLERLISAGQKAQSANRVEFDFTRPRRIPFWMPGRVARWTVSQFLHGEIATASACAALAARFGDGPEAVALDIQRQDECRHATFYAAYLEPLGGSLPVDSALERAYATASSSAMTPAATLLAFHVLLEGESLGLQKLVGRWLPCPLFAEISARVARDEARHVAFGRLWLGEHLPTLGVGEHRRLYCWLRSLWLGTMEDFVARLGVFDIVTGPKPWHCWVEEAWSEREAELRRLGLAFDASSRGKCAA